jgi:UDP-glucose 4-epimerase
MIKHIAVTGGSGKIGQAIIATGLRLGLSFRNIDRVRAPRGSAAATVPFFRADIDNFGSIYRALSRCDALIHLAAHSSPHGKPQQAIHQINVVGSYNVLVAAIEIGIKRICQASSLHAIGYDNSKIQQYDYFPIDELHPSYNDDAYALSKWICEQQADSLVRRYRDVSVVSLRLPWVISDRRSVEKRDADPGKAAASLGAYVALEAAAHAFLLALEANITGHEAFFIVAPTTLASITSKELASKFFPDTPIHGDFEGHCSFFDCGKAERMLNWNRCKINP